MDTGTGRAVLAIPPRVQRLADQRLGPTRANGLGTATMLIYPVNSLRYPAVKTLDFNFDKTIRLGASRRIVLNAAIFNIANVNTTLALANSSNTQVTNVSNVVRQNTSTANYLNTIVGPRVARFGVRVNF